MKKLFACMLFTAVTVPAFAYDYNMGRDTYVGFRVHKNERIAFASEMANDFSTTAHDDSFGIGLVVGNRLTDHVKIEFETAYTGGDEEKYGTNYDVEIWSNMLNVYLYQQFGGAVEPYAGLGVGIAGLWGSATGAGIDTSDATADLSWSAMVGVNFALNSRVDLNIGLKYQNYGDLDMKDDTHGHISTEVDATELYIGAAYKFGIGM